MWPIEYRKPHDVSFDKKKTIGGLVKVVVGLILGLVIAASVSVGIAASQDRLLTL